MQKCGRVICQKLMTFSKILLEADISFFFLTLSYQVGFGFLLGEKKEKKKRLRIVWDNENLYLLNTHCVAFSQFLLPGPTDCSSTRGNIDIWSCSTSADIPSAILCGFVVLAREWSIAFPTNHDVCRFWFRF